MNIGSITIREIHEQYLTWDRNSRYSRDDIWVTKRKKEYLIKILSGIATTPIILFNSDKKICIDGHQRINLIAAVCNEQVNLENDNKINESTKRDIFLNTKIS